MTGVWSTAEDQLLEQAARCVHSGSPSRWSKIAEQIGGQKSAQECRTRFEALRSKRSKGRASKGGSEPVQVKCNVQEACTAPGERSRSNFAPPPPKCRGCGKKNPRCGYPVNSKTCVNCNDPNSTRNKRNKRLREEKREEKAAVKAQSREGKKKCGSKNWCPECDFDEGASYCRTHQRIQRERKRSKNPGSAATVPLPMPLPLPLPLITQENNTTCAISGMNEGSEPEEPALQSTCTPAQQVLPAEQHTTACQFQTQVPISYAEPLQMRQPSHSNTTQATQSNQHTVPNQLSSSGNPHDAEDAEDFKSHDEMSHVRFMTVGIRPESAHELPMDDFDPDTLLSDAPVHDRIECDVTGMNPIVGTRYKKLGEDYDLCQDAFDNLSDAEAREFVRIETPAKAIEMGLILDVTIGQIMVMTIFLL